MEIAVSLIRSRQVASVGETVAATPLPAIVMEGLSYIYIGEKQLNIYIYIYIYIYFIIPDHLVPSILLIASSLIYIC